MNVGNVTCVSVNLFLAYFTFIDNNIKVILVQ